MKKLAQDYREFLGDFNSVYSFLEAVGLFFVSLIINYHASQYAFIRKDNPVTDIFLDNLPVVNMDTPFLISTSVFLAFAAIFLLMQPKRIAFVLKSIALFVIIRSIFVTLTHIGPSPLSTLLTPSEIGQAFTTGADLFFSGHTGMPFLFALIFWHNTKLRILFITMSVFAAVGVLLGHIHYSIDVASAYFITYGIYCIAVRWFKKDFKRFHNTP